jgi:hypothetical protein
MVPVLHDVGSKVYQVSAQDVIQSTLDAESQ